MENLNSKQSLRRGNAGIKSLLQDISKAIALCDWEQAEDAYSRIERIASSCRSSCEENHEASEEM